MNELPKTIQCPLCGEAIETLYNHGFTVWHYPNHMITMNIYGDIIVKCLKCSDPILQDAGSSLIPTASLQYVQLPEKQNKRDKEETHGRFCEQRNW